jgi:hypothetical protein
METGSNELRFGLFKSQNARLGVLYLHLKFHKNQSFLDLPKVSVTLLPLDWAACMCRFCHVIATSPY